MTIIYRHEKGAPLSSEEIDGNFKELEGRLKVIEETPTDGEGIGKIHLEGEHIKFTGTFGKDFGTFALPKPALNLCGPWSEKKTYRKLDLVSIHNALYCCTEDHMSTSWSQDHPSWKQVLTLPQAASQPLSLPLYEKATLPETESLGKLALLLEDEGATPLFFNGKNWQQLMKGESL